MPYDGDPPREGGENPDRQRITASINLRERFADTDLMEVGVFPYQPMVVHPKTLEDALDRGVDLSVSLTFEIEALDGWKYSDGSPMPIIKHIEQAQNPDKTGSIWTKTPL